MHNQDDYIFHTTDPGSPPPSNTDPVRAELKNIASHLDQNAKRFKSQIPNLAYKVWEKEKAKIDAAASTGGGNVSAMEQILSKWE